MRCLRSQAFARVARPLGDDRLPVAMADPPPCHGRNCPCRVKRVKWARCTSHPGATVAHLAIRRPGRGTWWYHLEHMDPLLFERVVNGSTRLADAAIEIATGMYQRGDWSRAVEYARIAHDGPYLSTPWATIGAESHVTVDDASPAPTAAHAGPQGWRRLQPAAASNSSTHDVEQLFFVSTNAIGPSDERMLHRMGLQLDGAPALHAQLWLLLLVDPEGPSPFERASARTMAEPAESLGCRLFLWTERALAARLPDLADAFNRTLWTLTMEEGNHGLYHYLHAVLVLWNQLCGRDYPRLKYVWRLEPDVVFAGSLATLLEATARSEADVLLPAYWSHAQSAVRYRFWSNMAIPAEMLPAEKRAWSMVNVGRYSHRFLAHWLAQSWRAGVDGSPFLFYEEIGVPLACLNAQGCVLAELGILNRAGRRVVYRPSWECRRVLRSMQRCDNIFWHPVKDRECLAFANESCTGGGHGAALTAPTVLWVGGVEGSWSSAPGSAAGREAPGSRITGFNFDATEKEFGRRGGLWGTMRDGTRVEVG